MNRTDRNPEEILDALIEEVRNDDPDPKVVEEAGRRVWSRIAAGHIESCEDFRALFPEYRTGSLSPGRQMLVEDHLHECVGCRKALHPQTVKMSPVKVVELPKRSWSPARWAAAAAVLVTAGLSSWYAFDKFGPAPPGNRATVLAASGLVYRLADNALQPVSSGASLDERQVLRTAAGGHAVVRLMDGSTVEVGERAELSVSASRRDTTVYLDRGQIIVEAAKRTRGHLYVTSPDSRVAVTGTVFAVNRGLKGSRVSVVEGSVDVRYRGNRNSLKPGDQVTTHPSVGRTSVVEEISWSQNFEQHLALLRQLVDLKEKLDQVQIASLRYGSRLLDSVPEGTTVYVSVPNLGRALAEVERIVKEQAAQSPELGQWMERQMPEFEKVTQRLSGLGEYLGEEIVVAFQPCKGFCGVMIADVHRPGLKEYLEKEFGNEVNSLRVEFAGNRVIIGEQQQFIDAAVRGGSRFEQSDFGQKISDVYRRGTGVLVAADLQALRGDLEAEKVARFGIEDVRYLIAEQREINGHTQYSAAVNFAGARRGIASWLAAPGPMGSLSFVSPNAQFATSFVVKDPAQMLQDVIALGGRIPESAGINLEDLAAALGGEVTVALDGPMLPTPSWKLVAEVRDAAKLQVAMRNLVEAANAELRKHQRPEIVLTPTDNGGNLTIPGTSIVEAHYVFIEGYLLAAPSEAMLQRAIADRQAGQTLARSQRFTRLLPRDNHANFSGMVYQNASEVIRTLAEGAGAQEIAQRVEPMMVAIYGEEDRIEIASQGSALDLLMSSMAAPLFHGEHRTAGSRMEKQ